MMRSGFVRRLLFGLGIAGVVLLVTFLLAVFGAGASMAAIGGATLAGLTAALAGRPVGGRASVRTLPVPELVAPASLPAPASSLTEMPDIRDTAQFRALRHDLRGILSPALLTADRLLTASDDPLVRRAAEAMVTAVERAEKRLASDLQ